MKRVFKVSVKIGKSKPLDVLFDDQDRANRFINALKGMLNEKGKKQVVLTPDVVELIDSDEDVLRAFSKVR